VKGGSMNRDDDQPPEDRLTSGGDSANLEPTSAPEVSDADGSCIEEVADGVTITWHGVEPSDAAEERGRGDGWHDLADGAEPFTPEQVTPDHGFRISEFMPDQYDTPGHGYAEPGSEDPDSPKAQLRRELVVRNRGIYEGQPPDALPDTRGQPGDEDS
jgi:hypothetical protein